MNSYTERTQYLDWIVDLEAACKAAREAGDWDRVDFLGLRLDAAREELAALAQKVAA